MDVAQQRWVILQIEKLIDAVVPKPNDITEIVVRFEGRKATQVDLRRFLTKFD